MPTVAAGPADSAAATVGMLPSGAQNAIRATNVPSDATDSVVPGRGAWARTGGATAVGLFTRLNLELFWSGDKTELG